MTTGTCLTLSKRYNFKDLTGQCFGRLTVIEFVTMQKSKSIWRCRCECGAIKEVKGNHLKSGETLSCGCLRDEQRSLRAKTHGHSAKRSGEYVVWASMKTRCLNPRHSSFPRYGGRGIKVCDRWMRFELFLADLGPRPSTSHTLERIDNNKDYEPDNCCWVPRAWQQRNTRNSRLLSFQGTTRPLIEWAEILRINYQTLIARLDRSRWPIEKAFLTPTNGK